MKPLKKIPVKSHRKVLEKTESVSTKHKEDHPVGHHKQALEQRYDSTGGDKYGFKTEPSPNASPSIKFIPKDGSPFGFPYAYLQHWYFENENTELNLIYSQGIVKITGGNLGELFNQLNQYKIKEIYVTGKTANVDNQTSIESIIVKRYREIEL